MANFQLDIWEKYLNMIILNYLGLYFKKNKTGFHVKHQLSSKNILSKTTCCPGTVRIWIYGFEPNCRMVVVLNKCCQCPNLQATSHISVTTTFFPRSICVHIQFHLHNLIGPMIVHIETLSQEMNMNTNNAHVQPLQWESLSSLRKPCLLPSPTWSLSLFFHFTTRGNGNIATKDDATAVFNMWYFPAITWSSV